MHTQTITLRTSLVVIGISSGLFTGCQTPDLKPFRDSTAQIHDSVVGARDIYLEEQQRIEPFLPADAREAFDRQSQQFQSNWSAREEMMEAMARYAGSLAAVAEAPDKSKAALAGVGDSIQELSVAAGQYAPAVNGAKDIALELVDLANRVRAAKRLKDAVLATDTNMQRVATILAADFGSMRRELEDRQASLKHLMDGPLIDQLHARHMVELQSAVLSQKLIENLKTNSLTNAVAGFNQDMVDVQRYLTESDKWYVPHVTEVGQAQKQLAAHIQLFRDTESALTQWGKAHAALAKALREGLPPDWTLLKQSADRIKTAIDTITNQENKQP